MTTPLSALFPFTFNIPPIKNPGYRNASIDLRINNLRLNEYGVVSKIGEC